MALDSFALWVITLANTLGILLVIRQLAKQPQYLKRSDPKPGTDVGEWALVADGVLTRSSELPAAYTLLFVASACQPCHALLTELASRGKPSGNLYLVTQDDGRGLLDRWRDGGRPPYDRFFTSDAGQLFRRLGIPGTPYAVAVENRTIRRAGVTPDTAALAAIMAEVAGERSFQRTTA
ncbi:MAG: hypothetical protein ACRDGT_04975 [Candidatus Limnocylindria bacterium]